MTQAETRVNAQALLAEAERLEATLLALRQQQAEAQEALELARASGKAELIATQEQARERLKHVSTLRAQAVQTLREGAERVLAALGA